MIAIFVYGFAYTYMITRILGYNLSIYQTLLPSIVSFLIAYTALKNKKTTIITILSLILITLISSLTLYFTHRLNEVINDLWIFFKPYYDSLVSGINTDLGPYREALIVMVLVLIFYKLLESYKETKYSFYLVTLVGISTIVIGFLLSRLSAISDRLSIVVFAIAQIMYFFNFYFIQKIRDDKGKKDYRFAPFFIVIAYYSFVGVLFAFLIFQSKPYPFVEKPKPSSQIYTQEENLYERYDYLIDKTGNIRDSFVFNDINIMEVSGDGTTKYLKGLVYESFDGQWSQANVDQNLNFTYMPLDDYGAYDYVEIMHTALKTPILFSGGVETTNMTVQEDIFVDKDTQRNTYNIINFDYKIIEEEIIYSYYGLNLNMQNPNFIRILNSSDGEIDLTGTVYELPDEYDYIRQITQDIVTDDMTNYEKTKAILTYLKKDYVYNIEPLLPLDDDADRIDFFLNGSKEGFCQHFATSASLMLRAENIPTRYVSGYLVDYNVDFSVVQFDRGLADALANGRIPVKDSDAHTWIEVYFNGVGWIPFETTGLVDGTVIRVSDNTIVPETDSVIESQMSAETKKILIIVVISISGLLVLFGLYALIIYIIRRKRYFRNGCATRQVMVLSDLIHDYLEALKFKRFDHETFREYAKRIDKLKLSDLKYATFVSGYEGIIYGGVEADESLRDLYLEYLGDIKKSARMHAGLISVIKTNVKELIST